MSGLSRVNQQRASERATRSATGTPVGGSGGPGSGFGPGAGFGGAGSGPGSGLGGGPGAGLGPGAGFARPASSASGPIYGGSGRASPFGRPASTASQYSESPFGGGMSSHAGPSFGAYGGAMEHQLEQHNDDLLGGLLGKVNTLKDLTVNIGKEVRDGNLELSGMNDTFGSTGNMLSGTFRRMTRMANRQGSNWCWFMGFLLIVFWIIIILWFFRR